MWKRLKNLWNLSAYTPEPSEEPTKDTLVLKRDAPYKKKKQRLATIVQPDALEEFPEENPEL